MNVNIKDLESILQYDKVNTSKYLIDYLEERLKDVIDQKMIYHYKRVIRLLGKNYYNTKRFPLIELRADMTLLKEMEVIRLMKKGILTKI
jgi:hypothetical protein